MWSLREGQYIDLALLTRRSRPFVVPHMGYYLSGDPVRCAQLSPTAAPS